jgi:WD40 repeat protein
MGQHLKSTRRFQFQIAGLVSFVLFAGSIGAVAARWQPWILVFELPGHQSGISDLRYSKDGTKLVSACGDQTARIWDAGSGKLLHVLPCHIPYVLSASFSRDDKSVLTSSVDGSVQIWDTITGQEVRVILDYKDKTGHQLHAAFSPDGSQILISHRDGNYEKDDSFVCDSVTGQRVLNLKGSHCAFSPSGKIIACCSNDFKGSPRSGTIYVCEASSGSEIKAVVGHNSPIRCIEFSPDSTCILTGSNDNTARIWNAQTVEQLAVVQRPEWVLAASFSPDGSRIISCSITALISDSQTGAPLYEFSENHTVGTSTAAAFSPDCNHVATGCGDGLIRIWERRHPEWRWGHFYRPEVWALLAFGLLWCWRVVKWTRKPRRFTY